MSADRKWLFLALGALVVALAGAEAFYFVGGGRGPGAVRGFAHVPTGQVVQVGGVLEVQGRVVHLLGVASPREEPDCTLNRGVVVHCTLIAAATLAELVAGKTIHCDLQRFGKDDRNWGVCRAVGSGAPGGNRIEDSINGRLLLSGWVLPNPAQGRDFALLGERARDAGAGLWPGNVVPHFVRTGILYGNTEVNDGNHLEIDEVRMRLYGIDAPDLDQRCTTNGLPYACGLIAFMKLIDLTAGTGRIVCLASKLEGDGRAYAKCGLPNERATDLRADFPSFNERMVLSGWALADRRHTRDYVQAEEEARKEKRGLWAGEFIVPAEWRDGKR